MDIILWIWIGVIALALVVEAISMDMTSIWFAVGGIVSLISYLCGASLTVQIILFVIVSALCIVFLRNITKKLIQKPTVATNIDSIIGTKAIMIDKTTELELGSIKVNGIVYSAKAEDNSDIESGTEVEIVKVEGNKMIVKPIISKNAETEIVAENKPDDKKE